MTTYDDYFAEQTEKYNQGCQEYKTDNGQAECCKSCDDYCQEYLNLRDNDDLINEIIDLAEYDRNIKNIKVITNEILQRMKK